MASTKGCIIIDRNGAVQLRVGDNDDILPITAMAHWNNKLVVGCGSDGGSQGNLAYFTTSAYTDMGDIDGGYAADTIASEYRTKMDDLGLPNTAKRLEAVTIMYYDNTAWNSMTMTLAYRKAKVTTSTSVVGGNTATDGSWTTISGAVITLDVQSGVTYKTINVGSDPAHAFQLRVTANGYIEIVKIIGHYAIDTQRQQ